MSPHPAEAFSREVPAPGLVIWQPRRGFRYALDPFCLAGWALEGGMPTTALDVGTGSGVVALLLAHAGVPRVTGVDVSPEWIALARRSAGDSGLPVRFEQADIRRYAAPAVDLVLCNPPYWPAGRGHLPADPLKAAARHELNGDLVEIVAAMARLGARLCLVLPAGRAGEGEAALRAAGRPPIRRCFLGQRLVLLEGRAGAGEWLEDRAVPLGDDLSACPEAGAWYARLGVVLRPNPSPVRDR